MTNHSRLSSYISSLKTADRNCILNKPATVAITSTQPSLYKTTCRIQEDSLNIGSKHQLSYLSPIDLDIAPDCLHRTSEIKPSLLNLTRVPIPNEEIANFNLSERFKPEFEQSIHCPRSVSNRRKEVDQYKEYLQFKKESLNSSSLRKRQENIIDHSSKYGIVGIDNPHQKENSILFSKQQEKVNQMLEKQRSYQDCKRAIYHLRNDCSKDFIQNEVNYLSEHPSGEHPKYPSFFKEKNLSPTRFENTFKRIWPPPTNNTWDLDRAKRLRDRSLQGRDFNIINFSSVELKGLRCRDSL